MNSRHNSFIRTRKPFVGRLALLVMILSASASAVLACTCGKSSTCERFNYYSSIFVGKAVRVEQEQEGSYITETTVFDVTEVFSGKTIRSIRVRSKSGFSCDYEFTVGETYLVFAMGNEKEGFGTGYCSGNLPAEYAVAEIAELRNLRGSKGNGKLLGTVLEEFAKRERSSERAPIKDIRIEVTNTSSGQKFFTLTDDMGRYQIVVPPGKYGVVPIVPPNALMSSTFDAKPVQLKSGGCSEGYFVFSNQSLVSGRLFDSEDKPVANARVELVSIDETRSYMGGLSDESDVNGGFSIGQIPAGKYTLSLNYSSNPNANSPFPTTFYPSASDRSAAKIIEIESGTRMEGLKWKLPKSLGKQTIAGQVAWDDGSPVIGAEIKLFDMAFPSFYAGCDLMKAQTSVDQVQSPVRSTSFNLSGPTCNLKSNEHGAFQLEMYKSRTYRITASLTQSVNGQKVIYEATSEPFELLEQPLTINLVIKKTR